jgi:hypothetical protein
MAVGTRPLAANLYHRHDETESADRTDSRSNVVILDERTAENWKDWINPGERDPFRLKSLLVPASDDNPILRQLRPTREQRQK